MFRLLGALALLCAVSALDYAVETEVFERCCAHPVCAKSFSLPDCSVNTYQRKRFSFLLQRAVEDNRIDTASDVDEIMCGVQNIQLCSYNEELDPEGHCVCKSGKSCDFSPNPTFSDTVQIIVSVAAVIVVLVSHYALMKELRKQRTS